MGKQIAEDFGVVLRKWRTENPLRRYLWEHRMTQVDAAHGCKVSPNTLQGWLQGNYSPSPENMQAVANFMGCSLLGLGAAWQAWENLKP